MCKKTIEKAGSEKGVSALVWNEETKEASDLLPKVISMLDRLVKRNIIHKNKASNLKSSLTRHVNAMA